MESRLSLYNRMMSERDELKPDFITFASIEIQNRVLFMGEFRTTSRIGLYAAFKNEVRTETIFQEGDKRRKELYYPAVDPKGAGLVYFRVMKQEDLILTTDGMKEPTSKRSQLRDLNTLNMIIVPGVVFDLNGGRIGYGKGFYDKCLEKFRGIRIALAFDFQVIADLPSNSRGRKVDWIVTEKRIIKCV